jgi:hypothetical protein
MITAEEIRLKYIPNGCVNLKLIGGGDGKPQFKHEKKVIDEMLVEFAKLHVEAALKAANEKATVTPIDHEEISEGSFRPIWDVDGNSILNAYPLTNIK